MATTKQKEAARKNLEKARAARSRKAASKRSSSNGSTRASSNGSRRASSNGSKSAGSTRARRSSGGGMSTAEKNDLPTKVFAFPKERKEPLSDAKHVRNAVARFDQVEGVTDGERAKAWKRIKKAAKKYDVDIEADSWKELVAPSTSTKKKAKAGKKSGKAKNKSGKKRSSAKAKKS